jgi:hypothetical protein
MTVGGTDEPSPLAPLDVDRSETDPTTRSVAVTAPALDSTTRAAADDTGHQAPPKTPPRS